MGGCEAMNGLEHAVCAMACERGEHGHVLGPGHVHAKHNNIVHARTSEHIVLPMHIGGPGSNATGGTHVHTSVSV